VASSVGAPSWISSRPVAATSKRGVPGWFGSLLIDEDGAPLDRFDVVDVTRRLARRGRVAEPAKVTPHVLRATAWPSF